MTTIVFLHPCVYVWLNYVLNVYCIIHSCVHCWVRNDLTHWGRVTHICVNKLTIIGSDNGLSPGRRQAIIWTNASRLLIGPLGTNFNETSIEIHTFSLKKIHLKMSSGKWRPFCLGPNVLIKMIHHHFCLCKQCCTQTVIISSSYYIYIVPILLLNSLSLLVSNVIGSSH